MTGGPRRQGRCRDRRRHRNRSRDRHPFCQRRRPALITGRRQDALNTAVDKIAGHVTAVRADVSEPSDLDGLFATVRKQAEHIDVLIANAGGGGFSALGQVVTEVAPTGPFCENVPQHQDCLPRDPRRFVCPGRKLPQPAQEVPHR